MIPNPFKDLTPAELKKMVTFPNLEISNGFELYHKKKSRWIDGTHSSMNIIARIMVMRSDGTPKEVREFQSKSFVANLMASMYDGLAQANAAYPIPPYPNGTNWGWKDRTNTLRTWAAANQGSYNGGNGVGTTTGIVLGSGTNAPSPTNYDLQTPIASGISSGQLLYLDNTCIKGITTNYPASNQTGFVLQRVFMNNSGGSISVSEMGLVWTDVNSNIQGLIARDTFTALNVAAGQTIVAQYIIYAGFDAVANFVTLIGMFLIYYFPYIDLGNYRTGTSYWLKNLSGSGGATNVYGASGFQNAIGGSGNGSSGIIFGTSATAPAITDYKLGAAIANGTGTGQLSYAAQTANPGPTISGQVTSMTLQRAAVNNSGGSITVTEEALTLSWGAILTHALVNGGTGLAIASSAQITGYKTISITT